MLVLNFWICECIRLLVQRFQIVKLGNMALAIYVSLANFGLVCILLLVQKFQIWKFWECGTGYFMCLLQQKLFFQVSHRL